MVFLKALFLSLNRPIVLSSLGRMCKRRGGKSWSNEGLTKNWEEV